MIESLSARFKKLDSEISLILRKRDISRLPAKLREQLSQLRQNMSDARIYITDYELSETREDQIKNSKKAKMYLDGAAANILTASQHDIFGPVDVAQLSAQIEQMKADLR
jgi:hypothetical protein